MASYNRVVLIGRLTRDPEMRYTSAGLAIAKFGIAVDRRFKNQQGEKVTDFFDCSAFRQKAEFVEQYVKKGRLVLVEGSIEINEVAGQDGVKKRYTNIICENVETLDRSDDGGGGGFGGDRGGRGTAPAEDNAYYPDEEPAPRQAPPQRAARPTPEAALADERPARSAPSGGRPAAPARGEAPARGGEAPARPAAAPRKPEPMYPEDDFDDSDPFADE